MKLTRDNWTCEDINEFQEYLSGFVNDEKRAWAINLLKTSLQVLCMKTVDIKDIVNKIYKGNYLKFLDLMIWGYYENTIINGFLINKIEDFNTKKNYLDIYSEKADNWATCDLLIFNVDGLETEYYNLVLEYIKSENPFKRRIGILVLFDFIDHADYIDKVFDVVNRFNKEDNYYVNMVNAWLLSECFICNREKTLKYFKHNKLNKFTLNKGIQKCRESHRVNEDDKEMLLKYRR